MAETPAYLKSKAAKFALGLHRGPLPQEDLDPETASEHLEETKTITLERTPTTATQTVIKHWKRFWCCYCFANVIFLAIFLPILFCIIIPVIAQRVVNDSSLKLDHAKIMEPRADSVLMSLTSTISLPVTLPVKINAFPLDLMVRYMPGNDTYAKAYIPETVIKETAQVGETKHPTPLNLPVWREFVHNAMFQETVQLSVHGSTMQHIGALHSMITMDKDVPLKGLDGLKGFAIKDTTLLLPPRDDGSNLVANATLPNPSPFTLEIGKTIFDVKSGDLVLGNATLDHLILERGNGTYPLHGILDLKKLIENLTQVLQTQKEAIRSGYLELTTVGKSVTYEGNTVDYYQEPLKSLVLPAKVPIGKLLTNTLHDLLNEDGKNILSGDSGGSGSPDLSSLINKLGDNGGLLGSLSDSGGGGGGLLSSRGDSSKDLNSRGLVDALDKPEELFAEAVSRLA